MKVPYSWLREYVDVTVEPARLAEDLTLAGLELAALERVDGDTILDLDITTNRVDCMNVYGVAREVSVLYGLPLKPLDAEVAEVGAPAEGALSVVVEAPDLCPRFAARVLDVRLGESPEWLRRRLEAVGVRPINNVVDLTNYVMMEMGHPSHAFDLAKIPQAELRIRWARAGERLVTLDGVERTLTPRCGVVASPGSGLALAGVMGGASSEVTESTRVVALEAAYWTPLAIRRAAKDAGVKTEASHRFERGADPEGPKVALDRIARLLVKMGAGTARRGMIDRRPVERERRRVALRPARLRAVLGVEVPEEKARAILAGLGFAAQGEREGATVHEVPSWRGDVAREVDLIEEVGRHFGLDKIPATIPPAHAVEGLRPSQRRERALRDLLVGAGLTEVVSYAFVADAQAAALPGERVPLSNPLSEEQGVLRRSLVAPGLMSALATNLRRGRRDVGIFEIGHVFHPATPLPREERCLGILLSGAMRPAHWSEKGRAADLFDAKGIVEAIGCRVGASLDVRRGAGTLPPHLHPGRAALVFAGESAVGYLGALHPDLAETWEFREEVIVAELSLEALLAMPAAATRYQPLERFPGVARDLSIVCDALVPSAEIAAQIRGAAGELLQAASVVDRYDGTPVPPGRVSLTFTLRFASPERTLTSEEVQASVERIVRALRSAGAEIRGEAGTEPAATPDRR
jgi:phenylalanyl-tRNA synthetase beta chain